MKQIPSQRVCVDKYSSSQPTASQRTASHYFGTNLKRGEYGAAPECKGGGKRDIPEKTRWPLASSGTIPTRENPGVTWPGTEYGSHCWEASSLTADLPLPPSLLDFNTTSTQNQFGHCHWLLSAWEGVFIFDRATKNSATAVRLVLCWRGRGGLAARLLASKLSEPGSNPGGVAPGFSRVGIVSDDAVCRRVISGISCFPGPFIPALLHSHLTSLTSALKTSLLQISPLLYTASVPEQLKKFYLPACICRRDAVPLVTAAACSCTEFPYTVPVLIASICSALVISRRQFLPRRTADDFQIKEICKPVSGTAAYILVDDTLEEAGLLQNSRSVRDRMVTPSEPQMLLHTITKEHVRARPFSVSTNGGCKEPPIPTHPRVPNAYPQYKHHLSPPRPSVRAGSYKSWRGSPMIAQSTGTSPSPSTPQHLHRRMRGSMIIRASDALGESRECIAAARSDGVQFSSDSSRERLGESCSSCAYYLSRSAVVNLVYTEP
ncbi:hypothetical protein PR048_027218 [Dryococelus australis]|uniref:Uncharacterized protein n=1 Tax=Dryococelus australis TaxID=614101 RepID=A0ABQ9GGL3_9NEOP|nr:hypothetical protein PR048_027218 [Dryococelus australis]